MRSISEETDKLLAPLAIGPHDQIEIGIWKDLERFTISAFSRYSDASPKMTCGSKHANTSHWQERIPDSKLDTHNRINAPTTDFTVVVICALWPENRIRFSSELAKEVFEQLAFQWKVYFEAAQQQADFKEHGILTDIAKSIPDPPGLHLGSYQKCAAACGASVPGYAYFMGMGTGKTPAAIARIDLEARWWLVQQEMQRARKPDLEVRPYRVIIVPPKNVRINWEIEIERFKTTRGRVHFFRSGQVERVKTIIDILTSPSRLTDPVGGWDWDALILSYGLLPNMIEQLTAINWDLAVLDESHFIMNSAADRTLAANKLRGVCDKRLILTGTPFPNRIGELFPQLEFLGRGYSGFKTKKAFTDFYQDAVTVTDSQGISTEHVNGFKNVPLLKERLARMSFIVDKKDVLKDLPPIVFDVEGVEMGAEQSKVYQRVLKELLIDAEKDLSAAHGDARSFSMTLQNVLKKFLRLAQITSGYFVSDDVCDDDGNILKPKQTHYFKPNVKLEALMDILRPKPQTSKTLIWACFIHDIHAIRDRLVQERFDAVTFYGATSERDRGIAVDRFNNDPACRFYISNPTAGGVGLNLLGHSGPDTNCDHEIFYSQNWSSKDRMQAECRPYRRGTRVIVRCTDLVVPGTIDQEIRAAVVEKRMNSMNLQDIRDLLGKLARGVGGLKE